MKFAMLIIFLSLLLWPFFVFSQNTDSLTSVTQQDSTAIIDSPLYFVMDSPGNQPAMIIDTLEGKRPFSPQDIDSARRFIPRALQQLDRQHQKKIQLAKTYNPRKIESELAFYDSYQGRAGYYLHVQTGGFTVKLQEIDIWRMLAFSSRVLDSLSVMDVVRESTAMPTDSISQSSQMIETELLLIPASKDSVPYMGFTTRNMFVALDSSALIKIQASAAQILQQIERGRRARAEKMLSSDLLTITSPMEFRHEFKTHKLPGIFFNSLKLFISIDDSDIYWLNAFLEQIKTDTIGGPDTTRMVARDTITWQPDTIQGDTVAFDRMSIPEQPRIITSPLRLFDSFQDRGGPFIYIDSLNTALALDQKQLAQLRNFLNEKSDLPVAEEDMGSETQPVTRYYATDLTARKLVASEISREAAQNQSHFRATFTQDQQLLSFEFIEKPKAAGIDKSNFKRYTYSRWNILLNDSINYYNAAHRRIDLRAHIFRNNQNRVLLVEYLDNKGQPLATGRYFYGFKNIIIEQRIEFEPGVDLTDVFPYYFDLKFNGLQPGWIAKGLYNDDGRLRRLVVMDEQGNLYYHYRFEYIRRDNQLCATAFVYNESNQLAGRYALFFNSAGILSKKISYNNEGMLQQKLTFSIDIRKKQLVIDQYDADEQLINRIYKPI